MLNFRNVDYIVFTFYTWGFINATTGDPCLNFAGSAAALSFLFFFRL